MEQKLKLLLGELMFQIASLQFNIELLQKENEELKDKIIEDLESKKGDTSDKVSPRFARRAD